MKLTVVGPGAKILAGATLLASAWLATPAAATVTGTEVSGGPSVSVTSHDLGHGIGPVALDRQRGVVYEGSDRSVATFNETSGAVADFQMAGYPRGIAIDQASGIAYVAEYWKTAGIVIIHGPRVAATLKLPAQSQPVAALFDAHTKRAFILEEGGDQVVVVNGGRIVKHIKVGRRPTAMVLDRRTQDLYVTDSKSHSVSVIHGGRVIATTTVPSEPYAIGLDAVKHRVYVACMHADRVAILHGTRVIATLRMPAMSRPDLVAVDSVHHQVVVGERGTSDGSSGDDSLFTGSGYTVIHGLRRSTTTQLGIDDSVDAVIADPSTSSFVIGIGDQADSDPSRVVHGDAFTPLPFNVEVPYGVTDGTSIWMPGIAPNLNAYLEQVTIGPAS